MKNAYYHWKTGKERRSFIIEVPSKQQISLMLSYFMPSITLDIGITACHPKDEFVKAIGREMASKNIINSTFIFKSFVNHSDGRSYILFTNYIYDVLFSIVKESDNVHLEFIKNSNFTPRLKEEHEL